MNAPSPTETEAILTLCLMAAFADGQNHEREREQLHHITNSLGSDSVNLPELYQHVLLEQPTLDAVCAQLPDAGVRKLAYEMALCVCDADGECVEAEQEFLANLRDTLELSEPGTAGANAEVANLASLPVSSETSAETTDAMIVRYAILGGALELLPQTIGAFAIVPMQTKMVYRIGRSEGVTLDRKSIVEFMATAGIGMASQVFETFARRLTKGLGRTLAGKLGGRIGDTLGGVAMSFATTYALGHLAKAYYESGRRLTGDKLRALYTPLLSEGKELAQRYSGQIAEKSDSLRGANLASLLRSGP